MPKIRVGVSSLLERRGMYVLEGPEVKRGMAVVWWAGLDGKGGMVLVVVFVFGKFGERGKNLNPPAEEAWGDHHHPDWIPSSCYLKAALAGVGVTLSHAKNNSISYPSQSHEVSSI